VGGALGRSQALLGTYALGACRQGVGLAGPGGAAGGRPGRTADLANRRFSEQGCSADRPPGWRMRTGWRWPAGWRGLAAGDADGLALALHGLVRAAMAAGRPTYPRGHWGALGALWGALLAA